METARVQLFLWAKGDVPLSSESLEEFLDRLAGFVGDEGFANEFADAPLRSVIAAGMADLPDEPEKMFEVLREDAAIIVIPNAGQFADQDDDAS